MDQKIEDSASVKEHTYLIKCGLSNIQEFIFNVKSDGAARAVKGRSFFLKLLLHVIIVDIFEGLKIDDPEDQEAAKISTSGGSVILKVETDDIQYIDKLQTRVDKILRCLDLNVNLAYVKYSNYKTSIELLDKQSKTNRFRRYRSIEDFEPIAHEEVIKTKDNKFWHKLPESIRQNKYLQIESKSVSNDELHYASKDKRGIFYVLSHPITFSELQEGTNSVSLVSFLESIVPTFKNSPKTFGNLVMYAPTRGAQKLGVLAMDVDKLGFEFTKLDSLASHMNFDARLNKFFNIKIRSIIEGENRFKDNVYTITAGGDDSYFVGKWDTLLALAQKIKESFNREFKELTISAALILVNEKFPVVRFADIVKTELDKAKYRENDDERGNISLFGEVVKWKFLEKQIFQLKNEFISTNRSGRKELKITAGLLAKARLRAKKISLKTGIQLSDFWEMQYYLRNRDERKKNNLDQVRVLYEKYMHESMRENLTELERLNYKMIFPIAARLAELETRKN